MKLRSLALTLPALLFAADAAAVRQPEYLSERPVETAAGARGRVVRSIEWEAPAAQARLWQDFLDAHGRWRAQWDGETGVPSRIFGEGIPAPGANADAGKAEAAARALLAERLAMLAPGAALADFELVSNVVHGKAGDLRTVGFVQTYRGLRVLGGQVSFLFKRDRLIVIGSQAAPRVDAVLPFAPVSTDDAVGRAASWIEAAYGARPTFLADGGLAILPLVREPIDGAPRVEHHAVRIVTLDLAEPRARWDVYVDAATGAPIARHQTLLFGAGTVKFNTPLRSPGGMRQDDPAPLLNVTVNGMMGTTGADGGIMWTGASPATVTNGVVGTRIRVTNGAGGGMAASNSFTVNDGGAGVWNAATMPCLDAQLTTFVHGNKIKAISKADLNPNLAWLDQTLRANVNEIGRCNAYFDGQSMHFFNNQENNCAQPSGLCENTGRIPDVVYHEFGHGLHQESIIDGAGAFDVSMSEGVSDYLAATTTGDPGMGRGFVLNSMNALRNLDPLGREHRWPDDIDEDPHATGLIIGEALWDMRKELVTLLGAGPGKAKADDYFYATLQRAVDIPSTYVEVLAADDDDGNLDNGTPNKCLVDRTFAPHGLVDPLVGFGVAPPTRDGNVVTQSIANPPGGCPRPQISGVVLEWRLRGEPALQSVTMTASGDDYKGSIPTQPDGSVVEYKVTITLAGGGEVVYPNNIADPMYQYFVGPLVPVYCTDFEADPFAAGWTHGRTGGQDDWEWGPPMGTRANGDPTDATSGANVIGNDVGLGDGIYQPNVANFVMSPEIDVSHATGVRLQYRRWLTVEDGFYDDAEIFADGVRVWGNLDSETEAGIAPHTDREWRFHDVDLGPQSGDGKVQIKFQLTSDEGAQFGGWTVDDFCIMARTNILPGCGDGTLGGVEECDDGNNVAGDGCTESCTIEPGVEPPDDGGCCSTGTSPAGPISLGLFSAGLLLRRKRGQAAGA